MPRSGDDIKHINQNRNRPDTLASLDVSVSTGKLELHRLTSGSHEATAVYAKDFDHKGNWVWNEQRKPRTVVTVPYKCISLPESGGYVVLKRISSNDGSMPKRLLPAWLSRQTTGLKEVAIDNHLQYFHRDNQALSADEGLSLIAALRSEESQAVIRSISGSTQVNLADLAQLRFSLTESA
ncbi:hypothetical protein [Enterovibrio norvegicus]|uniref:hypothetical protein n=1 Tax=Enterovibrio norvegicus TaxID=188144 RepID=UPI00352D6A6C